MSTSAYYTYCTLILGIILQYFTRWVNTASLVYPSQDQVQLQPQSHVAVPLDWSNSTGPDVEESKESQTGALHRSKRSSTRCRRQATDSLQEMLDRAGGRNSIYMDNNPHNFPNLLFLLPNKTSSLGSRRLRRRDVEAVLRDGQHPDLPEELQQHLQSSYVTTTQEQHKRSRRSGRSSGGTSSVGYCESNLPQRDDAYLKLCRSCMVTTELPENYFPRFLNEIVCDATQQITGCLFGNGRCAQRTFELSILRRTDECTRELGAEGVYYMEEWEVVSRPVRVGCECEVDPASALAALLTNS